MSEKIARGMLYLLAIVVLGWTGYRTVDLLSLTTDSPLVPWLGLAVFDGGMIVWTFYFLKAAEGTSQRAVALVGGLVDLALMLAAVVADLFLGGQQLAEISDDAGVMAIWLIAGATGVNVLLLWLAHVTDPQAMREIRLRAARDKVMDQAYKQLDMKTDEIADDVANRVSDELVDEAVRALGGRARPAAALPAPPVATTTNGHTPAAAYAATTSAGPKGLDPDEWEG